MFKVSRSWRTKEVTFECVCCAPTFGPEKSQLLNNLKIREGFKSTNRRHPIDTTVKLNFNEAKKELRITLLHILHGCIENFLWKIGLRHVKYQKLLETTHSKLSYGQFFQHTVRGQVLMDKGEQRILTVKSPMKSWLEEWSYDSIDTNARSPHQLLGTVRKEK